MQLSTLELVSFRNIDQLHLELHPLLTVILGANGSGKTNILEAISLLSVPRSFRGGKDTQLVQWESSFARVEGSILSPVSQSKQLVVFIEEGKKLLIDGQPQSVTDFLGQFLSVLFAPEDVSLLSGPPADRRGFLDAHLSLLSHSYLSTLVGYQRVLSRRNKLLGFHRASRDELEYWNEQQIVLGTKVIEGRLKAVEQLNQLLETPLGIQYSSTLIEEGQAVEDIFRQKQAHLLDREREVGHTLLGPQRDDWRLLLRDEERDLGIFGSRGEQRMGVVLLKQSQLKLIAQTKGEVGVLLLDDVLSELDAANQERLLASVANQQTILTTASLTDVPKRLLKDAWVYEKADGGWQRGG